MADKRTKRKAGEISERPSITDAFYRASTSVSEIPDYVKWYIVSLLDGAKVAPSIIAELDLPFGKY